MFFFFFFVMIVAHHQCRIKLCYLQHLAIHTRLTWDYDFQLVFFLLWSAMSMVKITCVGGGGRGGIGAGSGGGGGGGGKTLFCPPPPPKKKEKSGKEQIQYTCIVLLILTFKN